MLKIVQLNSQSFNNEPIIHRLVKVSSAANKNTNNLVRLFNASPEIWQDQCEYGISKIGGIEEEFLLIRGELLAGGRIAPVHTFQKYELISYVTRLLAVTNGAKKILSKPFNLGNITLSPEDRNEVLSLFRELQQNTLEIHAKCSDCKNSYIRKLV